MQPTDTSNTALLYCRPGMEKDCAAEVVERAAGHGVAGWCRTADGYLEFASAGPDELHHFAQHQPFAQLIFPRQWCALLDRITDLPATDRAGPIASALTPHIRHYGALRIEQPDSNDGRSLARLGRRLRQPIAQSLAAYGITAVDRGPTLHVFLTAGDSALLGLSDPDNASPWPGGIPRLRLPGRAPSRSASKLEEAFQRFLSADERAAWLRPGRRAVDLGAAPGGWSWLLAERGVRVDAVDNAELLPTVTAHPGVSHHRSDGFGFRPRGDCDWLVCDIVEQPHRIVRLVAEWFERRRCRHAIFNLKLPMKKRWATVRDHLLALEQRLPPQQRIAAGQLYHDREEVTVFATRAPLGR